MKGEYLDRRENILLVGPSGTGKTHLATAFGTANLPFENWIEVLGSERLTGAGLDRLTHRCHILELKGES